MKAQLLQLKQQHTDKLLQVKLHFPEYASLKSVHPLYSDFVSRFFAPPAGIDEDAVTGSAHTTLTPFWMERLDKKSLHAYQLSHRKGELFCELAGDRVLISGKAVTYLKGEIAI